MPVYNVERFVVQAVRSVLNQTFTDFELIIVDDGGSDRSIALCQAMADHRTRFVRQANRGLAGARNTGIAAARGAFIAGCGHAGDGNVHLSVFETDENARHALLDELFAAGLALGGQISGEHGVGTAKLRAYERFTDPARLALEARLKVAFDPDHLFNPHLSPQRRPTP